MVTKDANHLIIIAGMARKLKISPKQMATMLDKDGEKNRAFWNEMISIRTANKKKHGK